MPIHHSMSEMEFYIHLYILADSERPELQVEIGCDSFTEVDKQLCSYSVQSSESGSKFENYCTFHTFSIFPWRSCFPIPWPVLISSSSGLATTSGGTLGCSLRSAIILPY